MNPNGQNGNNNSFGGAPNNNFGPQNNPQPVNNQPIANTFSDINRNEQYNPNNFFKPEDLETDNQAPTFAAPQANFQQQAPQMQTPMQPSMPQMQQPMAQPMQTMQPMGQPMQQAQPVMPQMQMPQPVQATPTMPAPQPAQAPVQKKSHALEIVLIVFIFLIGAGAIGGAAYCQSQYSALDSKVSSETSIKVREAKEAQKEIDDKAYEIRNASELKEFTGPSDFGAITFKYPKNWNIYLKNNDDSNPGYEAYFSPNYVPPTTGESVFALSFKIESQDYNTYMKKFEQKKLSSTSAFSINGLSGSKIMGKLDEKQDQPNGAEVVLQINNYVAVIRTYDYDLYGTEFDAILADLASANY